MKKLFLLIPLSISIYSSASESKALIQAGQRSLICVLIGSATEKNKEAIADFIAEVTDTNKQEAIHKYNQLDNKNTVDSNRLSEQFAHLNNNARDGIRNALFALKLTAFIVGRTFDVLDYINTSIDDSLL